MERRDDRNPDGSSAGCGGASPAAPPLTRDDGSTGPARTQREARTRALLRMTKAFIGRMRTLLAELDGKPPQR
jgi:hypothetical protein